MEVLRVHTDEVVLIRGLGAVIAKWPVVNTGLVNFVKYLAAERALKIEFLSNGCQVSLLFKLF